jgi:hypothetical protein
LENAIICRNSTKSTYSCLDESLKTCDYVIPSSYEIVWAKVDSEEEGQKNGGPLPKTGNENFILMLKICFSKIIEKDYVLM